MIQKNNDNTAITILGVPALDDNYVWIITQGDTTVVIDPGESAPVIEWLKAQQRQLTAILITHPHHDHIGGVQGLLDTYPASVVYAHQKATLPFVFLPLSIDDTMRIEQLAVSVLDLSGHTPDQIGYYLSSAQALFCGDALFAGGCGRLFNGGTAAQMTASLARIRALPEQTNIYCAHEYTLANLRFAHMSEPDNQATRERLARVIALRKQGLATVPSVLVDELATNPFLRTETQPLHQAIDHWSHRLTTTPVERFAQLRAWKDSIDATGVLEDPI